MFAKKIERLAEGGRSYLCKRLKGSDFPIFESKLDAGQRILWTKFNRDNRNGILVSDALVFFIFVILFL